MARYTPGMSWAQAQSLGLSTPQQYLFAAAYRLERYRAFHIISDNGRTLLNRLIAMHDAPDRVPIEGMDVQYMPVFLSRLTKVDAISNEDVSRALAELARYGWIAGYSKDEFTRHRRGATIDGQYKVEPFVIRLTMFKLRGDKEPTAEYLFHGPN